MQESTAVSQRCALLQSLRASATPADMGPVLLRVEEALFSSGRLDEEWAERWREDWRSEVLTCSHLQDCLLYTAALQV